MKNRFCSFIIFIAAVLLAGCGDPLLSDLNPNVDVTGGSEAENYEQAVGMFLTAQQKMHDIGAGNGAHVYQVQFNIHIDNYSGYLASTQNFGGNLPSTYRYFAEYADGPKASFFNVAQATLPVMRSADRLGLAEIGAMCNIMYCFSALELSDIYGPFPWTDYKNDKQEPPVTYEPMDQIYDSIFANLDASITVLEKFSTTTQEHQDSINTILAAKDYICGATVDGWRRFANTIMLRMAVRMSNVAPDRAKERAQKAIDSGLILQSVELNLQERFGLNHPVVFISYLWNDTRLNASFENIAKRLQFPFLETIFARNSKEIKNGSGKVVLNVGDSIVGVRTGIQLTPRDDNNPYVGFSGVKDTYGTTPLALIKLSEVYFLRAEADLRWSTEGGGMYESIYIEGIQKMFESYKEDPFGDKFWNYYFIDKAGSDNYVDPSNERNNLDGIITIGVMIDPNDDPKVKLEKIITQKWLANFPMGLEAWNDLRRTGYPRIFPTNDIGDGTLGKGRMIRRIPWNETDAAASQDVNSSGVAALGDGNYMATTLWWDVEDPNGFGDNRWWERQ